MLSDHATEDVIVLTFKGLATRKDCAICGDKSQHATLVN